jgi:replicative DNA helicase
MPQKQSAKVPPQDLDAERSVLGAVLKTDDVMANLADTLKSEDFYEPKHQLIYAAMLALYERSQPIDLLTLTSKLKQQKQLDAAGGSSYLSALTNYVPTAAHSEAYADIVARCALRRRLIRAAGEIAEQAYDEDGEIDTIVDAAEKELFQAADQKAKHDLVPLGDILIDTFDRIEELQNNKGALRGLKTGFADLDHKTAGFQKSDLIIIGARPAMGKTTLAQNLIYNVASINKKPVLFFSLEMSREQIVDRMIADVANVDSWKIRTGNLSGDDYKKIADATDEMSEVPIFIDDSSGTSILEMRTKARRAAHDHDIGMIVVDYLQLMSGSAASVRNGNRVQEVSEISRGLKLIARELNIPVIALAQLSRQVTGRDNPRPVLSDLRESGSIEQDADLVMFIHRPDYYKQNDDDYEKTNITELLIAKHRNGPIGKIELYFDPERLRFMTLDKEHASE